MKSQRWIATSVAAASMLLLWDVQSTQGQQGRSTASQQLPSFEVASIKPDTSGSTLNGFQFADPSRFRGLNLSLAEMIQFAYNIKQSQLSGGPAWIQSRRYVVDAKIDDALAGELGKLPKDQQIDQVRLMLRSLLADRFKLVLSRTTKEEPIYSLVVAKNGPKLTAASIQPNDRSSVSPQPNGPHLMVRPGKVDATAVSMDRLADLLSYQPDLGGRLVVNRTGLTGNYDFSIRFAQSNPFPDSPIGEDKPMPGTDYSGPSIFTALSEQLGLRLESAKGPVNQYTIERVEELSEN